MGDRTRPFVSEDSLLSILVQLFGPKKHVSQPTKPFVFEDLLTIHSSAFWAQNALSQPKKAKLCVLVKIF